MPLRSFTVERYRSFAARTTVELRPMTLLFGYNGAGKSALLRLLPLLAASVGGADIGPLALDAEVARGATYGDLRCRFADRNLMAWSVAWDDDSSPVREIEIALRAHEGEKQHILERLVARDSQRRELLRLVDVPEQLGRYELELSAGVSFPLRLDGVRPIPPFGGDVPEVIHGPLQACSARLASLQTAVHWLGAIRASPQRKGDYRGIPARLGGDGGRAVERLAYDWLGKRKLFNTVSAAIKSMFDQRLYIREDGQSFALELEPADSLPVRVSVVDTGEGVTQVLPVLTLGAMALEGELPEGAILALEHPELHLHPRAERELSKFLCEVARRAPCRPRMIIETHSENLLLFSQLAVAKQLIRPEEISILWVETNKDGSGAVTEIALDERGRPQNWPIGVFSEDVDLARELFLARRGPPAPDRGEMS